MYKNSTPWDKLSMAERSDVMNLAIKQGITNLDDIRATYNSFGNGGDKKSKSSYIHDVLPELLRKAGLNIRVTSGYRPAGAVGTAGSKSWHPRHGAVDIVPQGNTTFEDIERVVTTNPEIVRYMTSNGFGFLDETNRTAAGKALMKKTGATGNHFHFGKDTSARNRYQKLLGSTQATTQPSVNTVLGPSTAAIETQSTQTYTLPTPAPVQMYTPNPLPTPDLEAIEDFYKTTAEKRARREALTSMLTPQQPVAYIPQVQVPQSFLAHPMLQAGNAFGDGGSIHIKPSHRGRLTELKKRTGKSEAELYNDGNPAHKKMVVFARNARKWKHADGGPLVDAANAHIYDGTTEPTQQMNNDYIFTGRPSQYDFQITAPKPTVYWDGFNWIGFNDLGQRVTKGPDFNPSGARIIKSPQEFENARLAQAGRTDINGTHRFAEDVRNFVTDLVMMPAGDIVAEPLGILGGKALNAAAKTKAGKAVMKGVEGIASKFTKGKPVTPAEFWAKDISSKTRGNVGDKEAVIEQARQALIDWVKSPHYKERASNEAFYNVADDVIEDAASTIENAPIEIKDRSLILSRANGETSPRPTIETVLPDGTNMFDFDTGLDVSAASDLNEESLYSTILHELEHYMTANSHGITLPRKNMRVIDGGWFSPEEVHFDLIDRIHKNRGKGWQRYIMDQNDALLPKYDSVVKMVMEEPEKAKSLFMQAGKTAEEAQQKVASMQDYYSYLYSIQEQRAFLQELFHTKIKPNIKNPNNASEIESYLIKHPEILNDFPAFERIQEIRPGNIKQYASYFASALSTLPFISKQINNE